MRLHLHYETEMGPRTMVVTIPDKAMAVAILNAHLATGEYGMMTEDGPIYCFKKHLMERRGLKLVKTGERVVLRYRRPTDGGKVFL